MNIGRRIKDARKSAGYSQIDLAQAMQTRQSTVSDWERNINEVPRAKLKQISEILSVSLLELEFGESAQEDWDDNFTNDKKTQPKQIPMVGDLGAGGHINPVDDHHMGGGLEQVPPAPDAAEGTVAVRVSGDSLYPFLKAGALIYYSRRENNITDYLHEMVICHLADGRKALKVLTPGTIPGRFTLTSVNASPMQNEQVESVSPIDWMKP